MEKPSDKHAIEAKRHRQTIRWARIGVLATFLAAFPIWSYFNCGLNSAETTPDREVFPPATDKTPEQIIEWYLVELARNEILAQDRFEKQYKNRSIKYDGRISKIEATVEGNARIYLGTPPRIVFLLPKSEARYRRTGDMIGVSGKIKGINTSGNNEDIYLLLENCAIVE